MATHAGSEGIVKNGNNTVAEVRSWTIDMTADTVDTAIIGDEWKNHQITMKSWSGSANAWWDETDTNGQAALTIGSSFVLNLYPEGDGMGDTFFSGTALVTGLSVTGAHDNVVEANFTFQGTGPLTIDTVP